MSSYKDLGYNKFLIKTSAGIKTELTADEVASRFSRASGSNISGGLSKSSDGKTSINWDTGEVVFSDGARGRVFLGKIAGTDEYGIKIVDAEGNVVMTSGMELQGPIIGGSININDVFTVDSSGNLVASSANFSGTGYTKINIFKQDAIPTSVSIGDLWFDTDDDNKPYVAESVGADEIKAGEWVIVDDQRAADALLKTGTSQTLTGNFNLNDANVLIDGANKRILINDGTNDRILIGYQSGGF
jgi:hypothetical protein